MPAVRFVFLVLAVLFSGFTRGQDAKPLPRVLIIGDSISLGYTEPVRKRLAGTAELVRPRENCQHTAYGLSKIKAWVGDGKWDVIHFNWGIWDTHMLGEGGELIRDEDAYKGKMTIRHTPEQYRENLTKLVAALEGTGAKLVWASTTPVMRRTGPRFEDVAKLNAVAAKLMADRKIAVNDLYGYALPHAKEWQTADKVHFNAAGNEKLADRVAEAIREALAKPAGR